MSEQKSNPSPWGDGATAYFYELTPERILPAIENGFGVRCTGHVKSLHSLENRVYEIGFDDGDFAVAKFYRPGRWSAEQIEEEHLFLAELEENDISVASPYADSTGKSLLQDEGSKLYFALFPKLLGRAPDELTDQDWQSFGRLIGRVHTVGKMHAAKHRLNLDVNTFGYTNLSTLKNTNTVPSDITEAYFDICHEVLTLCEKHLNGIPMQRIHGDCHRGNLLRRRDSSLAVLDFDDMVVGPCAQDFWLLIPGKDDYAQKCQEQMIEGYKRIQPDLVLSAQIIESLRALRYIHFVTWIAKRWSDPAFPAAFAYFTTPVFWQNQLHDMREQWSHLREI